MDDQSLTGREASELCHEISGDWNRVDAVMLGDQAVFAVNGHVVLRLTDAKTGRQSDGKTLTSGRIQIQSEAAEIFYRDIRIRSIESLPDGDKIENLAEPAAKKASP